MAPKMETLGAVRAATEGDHGTGPVRRGPYANFTGRANMVAVAAGGRGPWPRAMAGRGMPPPAFTTLEAEAEAWAAFASAEELRTYFAACWRRMGAETRSAAARAILRRLDPAERRRLLRERDHQRYAHVFHRFAARARERRNMRRRPVAADLGKVLGQVVRPPAAERTPDERDLTIGGGVEPRPKPSARVMGAGRWVRLRHVRFPFPVPTCHENGWGTIRGRL